MIAPDRHSARMNPPWDLSCWRASARAALRAGLPPEAIDWGGDPQAIFAVGPDVLDCVPVRPSPGVPAAFLTLAAAALCHRDPQRHALLYRLLWRIASGERGLLERATDADVHRVQQLAKVVRRGAHKMKAFVRFREVPGERDAFMAWFEPEHFILDRVAPFFARRFAGMRWALVTPYRSAAWDGVRLAFGAGGARTDAPMQDAREALWRTYYAHIFNPARLNLAQMRAEMPQKYWKLLPEVQMLPGLVREAGVRAHEMVARAPSAPRRRSPGRREPIARHGSVPISTGSSCSRAQDPSPSSPVSKESRVPTPPAGRPPC